MGPRWRGQVFKAAQYMIGGSNPAEMKNLRFCHLILKALLQSSADERTKIVVLSTRSHKFDSLCWAILFRVDQ